MTGKRILCGFFLVGILLTFSSANKSPITIAYQPDDIRAIVADVIRSDLATLNASMHLIRDTLSAMSSDIAVIKSKLANSRDDVSGTTADPTTTPGSTYTPTTSTRMTTTRLPDPAQYVSVTYFDDLVRRTRTPPTGKTFNESTVSDIMSKVSRTGDSGNGVVVVLINHLNRPINNFKMYDPNRSSLHAAPSSIAPHTKEIFTFAEPSCCMVRTAFSYDVLGNTASISSFMDFYTSHSCGLAFVPNSDSMEQYLVTRTGFPGSYRKELLGTLQLAIRYQNLYAKMSVNANGGRIATVVIEIVEESNARNSGDEFSGTTETTAKSELKETTERHAKLESRYSTTSYPYWGTTNVNSQPDIAQPVSLTYFDNLVRRKPTPLTGKTFNGSTVSDIMYGVSRVGDGGRGVVVVLINHLNRTINNFKMYDPNNSSLHAAPSSIAPHTKEVFTFAEPFVGYCRTAFSYDIPGNRAGISSFMDFTGAEWCGLAFLPTSHSMEEYFSVRTGFPGSSLMELLRTQQLAIRYGNLYAKMSANKIGTGKATVVIEIAEESYASNSGDELPGTTVFFDELVSRKPSPQQGKTFNSSTTSEIMSRVSRVGDGGRGTVVVFINHLDRIINRFEMYDRKNSSLHAAPSSITPHTKEVFTFAEPSCCYVTTAFSFNIPGRNAGIASFMHFSHSAPSMGVAFIPTHQTMEQYYNSRTGYPGSSLSDRMRTQKLAVRYQNLYAKMAVNEIGDRQVTVVIEVVEDLNGTTSEPSLSPTSDEYFPTEETVTEDYY